LLIAYLLYVSDRRSFADMAKLWEDFDTGLLNRKVADRDALVAPLAERTAERVDWQGWRAIDAAERKCGSEASRPRVKFVDLADMLAVANMSVVGQRH